MIRLEPLYYHLLPLGAVPFVSLAGTLWCFFVDTLCRTLPGKWSSKQSSKGSTGSCMFLCLASKHYKPMKIKVRCPTSFRKCFPHLYGLPTYNSLHQ